MGFTGGVWQLAHRSGPAGRITVEEADFPWLYGRFTPGPAYPEVRPLFVRARALCEAEDWTGFDSVYDEIRAAVSLTSPDGPVPEFLLHIDGDTAWFRWSDEPFDAGP